MIYRHDLGLGVTESFYVLPLLVTGQGSTMAQSDRSIQNRLLAALTQEDLEPLVPHLHPVNVEQRVSPNDHGGRGQHRSRDDWARGRAGHSCPARG